jgi:predicted alpha/beta-hydrolase family hydrolase
LSDNAGMTRRGISVYPTENAHAGLILAHGAGAGQKSPFMVAAARALAARGIVTATFDFPYMAEGRKLPDKGPVLEDAWREAIADASARPPFAGLPLFIGGKSMGGRIASQAAAEGPLAISGLVFLGYPLHPPGKPTQRRDAHLPKIHVPMLFVQGGRDAFGSAAEIRELLPRLAPTTELYEVEGGDHSFKVPARLGKPAAVLDGIFDAVATFIQSAARS